jgi:hypothetical protein
MGSVLPWFFCCSELLLDHPANINMQDTTDQSLLAGSQGLPAPTELSPSQHAFANEDPLCPPRPGSAQKIVTSPDDPPTATLSGESINDQTRTDVIALPDVAPFTALVQRFEHFVHSIEASPQGSAERFVQVKHFEGEVRRDSDFSDYVEWIWEVTSTESVVIVDGPFKHQAEKAVLLMRQFRYLLSVGPV